MGRCLHVYIFSFFGSYSIFILPIVACSCVREGGSVPGERQGPGGPSRSRRDDAGRGESYPRGTYIGWKIVIRYKHARHARGRWRALCSPSLVSAYRPQSLVLQCSFGRWKVEKSESNSWVYLPPVYPGMRTTHNRSAKIGMTNTIGMTVQLG